MKIVDYRGRHLEIGKRIRVEQDISSHNGTLYKHTLVKLEEINIETKQLRVSDDVGKVWWVEPTQVSASFL